MNTYNPEQVRIFIEADISRAVEHWARVSPKWYPTGGSSTPSHGGYRCRPHELTQAIFMESDATPVFVGKCTKCSGTTWERMPAVKGDWMQSLRNALENGWERDPEDPALDRRACTACIAGKTQTPVAVLLSNTAEGDAAARDALLAHADQLLADGNPLGELLNWTLLLWMREPADLRHADEAVRWLEWLTAQHALVRNRNASNYTVTVDGYEYHVAAHGSMTASEIAETLNAQGGPATFIASADGSAVVTTILNGATSSTVIVAGGIRDADLLPLPEVSDEPTRRQHASHIGSRLGRRLGVRR